MRLTCALTSPISSSPFSQFAFKHPFLARPWPSTPFNWAASAAARFGLFNGFRKFVSQQTHRHHFFHHQLCIAFTAFNNFIFEMKVCNWLPAVGHESCAGLNAFSPECKCSSMARPLAMPPAAITGMVTAFFTSGTNTMVVVSSRALWPPASNPLPPRHRILQSCALVANRELPTTCTTVQPFFFQLTGPCFRISRTGENNGALFLLK